MGQLFLYGAEIQIKPLTDGQKAENGLISKVRARVEHVFGFMTRSMCGMVLNCIGLERAKRDIGLKNLGYNIKRLVTINCHVAQHQGGGLCQKMG